MSQGLPWAAASVVGVPPPVDTFMTLPNPLPALVQYTCVASTVTNKSEVPCPDASVTRQRPAVHAAVEGGSAEHTTPHPPQSLLSCCTSTHAPAHKDWPGGHTHGAVGHAVPLGQVPHADPSPPSAPVDGPPESASGPVASRAPPPRGMPDPDGPVGPASPASFVRPPSPSPAFCPTCPSLRSRSRRSRR